MTFKARVHREIIAGAAIYKKVFIDYDYLIHSKYFNNKPYYIIRADKSNYAHLTGVNSLISAQDFFDACLDGALREDAFDFSSKRKSEKEVMGSVRRKIQILPSLAMIFENKLYAEENFTKGKITCSLATADNTLTIGFAESNILRPKTLLKSNELDCKRAVEVTLVLRRERGTHLFDTVIQRDAGGFVLCDSY